MKRKWKILSRDSGQTIYIISLMVLMDDSQSRKNIAVILL